MTSSTHSQPSMYPRAAVDPLSSPMPGETNQELLRDADARSETAVRQVWAQGMDFVGLPGDPEKLQTEILALVKSANAGSDGFIGSLVLFSEQEGRLVTVITLWADAVRLNQGSENSTRLKRLLGPYVDRWLRSSKFVTFLLCPNVFGIENWKLRKQPLGNNAWEGLKKQVRFDTQEEASP